MRALAMRIAAEIEQMRPQRRLLRQVEASCGGTPQRLGEIARLDMLDPQPRPRGIQRQHLLVRHAQRLGEHGAQALVPRHQVAERQLQCADVEIAHEPHRQRNRVGRVRTFEPIEEPEPALRERQRDLRRPWHRRAAARAAARRRRAAPPGPRRSGPRTGCGSRARRSSAERMRPISRVASSEWPPSSKKLSSMPTSASPSVSANSAHSTASCGVRGSRRVALAVTTGAGSARRSSLPFGVSGSRSSSTKAAGTM